MNSIPGSSTQRTPTYNPDQQVAAATDAHPVTNVTTAETAANMATLQAAQAQVEGATSGAHEKKEFELEHVPNSLEAIQNDEVLRVQLDQIAAIIKDMVPREVEIKVFSPFFKELGALRGAAVKAYLVGQDVREDLLDVKLRGPGLDNKHFALANESGIIIEVWPQEPGEAAPQVAVEMPHSPLLEPGHIRP